MKIETKFMIFIEFDPKKFNFESNLSNQNFEILIIDLSNFFLD